MFPEDDLQPKLPADSFASFAVFVSKVPALNLFASKNLLCRHVANRYLEGGVESGFRKVQRGVYEKRLFHVKGKRDVRCSQVGLELMSPNTTLRANET